MKKGGFAIIILSFIFALGFFSATSVANNIPIQIQTLDGSGNVITGTFAFQINISNSVTCTPVLYSDTRTETTDSRGIVSYALENVNLPFDEQYWFCYYRDGVLKETIKAARVPYAFQAKNTTLSGVAIDSNLNLGSYNVTAAYFLGDGSQLTGINLSGALSWANALNGTLATWANAVNGTLLSYAQALNNTLMLASNWNATNISYYLATNPFGFYNSTTLPAGTEPLWNANYSTFLTHITWANAVNGTLATWGEVMNGTVSSGGSGVPVGTISAFNLSSCPTGWIAADGTAGTPDLRGIFIRGSGTNSILKYANNSIGFFNATYGTYGNDSMQGHYHGLNNVLRADLAGTWPNTGGSYGTYSVSTTYAINDGTNGNPRTGAETTPAYYATIYCIKTGTDSTTSNSIWTTVGNLVQLNNASQQVSIQTNLSVGSSTSKGYVNFSNASTTYYAPVAGEPSAGTLHLKIPQVGLVSVGQQGVSTVTVDASSYVPVGTKAVAIVGNIVFGASAGSVIFEDTSGNQYGIVLDTNRNDGFGTFIVPLDSSRKFQFVIGGNAIAGINVNLAGYWI